MNILALDLATKTGWALLENGRIESGVEDFTKKRGESNGMLFLKFNRWLEVSATKQGPRDGLGWPLFHSKAVDLIVFEQAHHRGGAATEIAVGLMTRVLECCAKYYIEHASVHTATLKKFATGDGRADKEEMIAAALRFLDERTGKRHYPLVDDNEGDALCLLKYAIENFGGSSCRVSSVPSVEVRPLSTTPGE